MTPQEEPFANTIRKNQPVMALPALRPKPNPVFSSSEDILMPCKEELLAVGFAAPSGHWDLWQPLVVTSAARCPNPLEKTQLPGLMPQPLLPAQSWKPQEENGPILRVHPAVNREGEAAAGFSAWEMSPYRL